MPTATTAPPGSTASFFSRSDGRRAAPSRNPAARSGLDAHTDPGLIPASPAHPGRDFQSAVIGALLFCAERRFRRNALLEEPLIAVLHTVSALRPSSSVPEITRAIAALQLKVEEIAAKAGVPSGCADMEATLGALPASMRRRLTVLLDAVRFNAELNGNRAMAFAAGYVLNVARDIWGWREDREAPSSRMRRSITASA